MMKLSDMQSLVDDAIGLLFALRDQVAHVESLIEEPPLQASPQKRRQPCPRCGGIGMIETGQDCPICTGNAENPRTEGLDPPEEEEPAQEEAPPASSPIPGMSAEEYADRMARAAHSRAQHRAMYGKRSPFAKDDQAE